MNETEHFGLLVLIVAGAGLAAVLSNRIGEHVKVPVPVIFLITAALARHFINPLHAPSHLLVERLVTLALLLVLFDGGRQIGWTRFRQAAAPIVVVGVLGTFLTTAATALCVHLLTGLSWYLALLIATAVAPTDPAIVFSVLGQREIAGRASTILEGESGANDPVGIALMVSLIAAHGAGLAAFGHVGTSFVLQMGVGAAVGLLGGWGLRWHMRHVSLPSEGLYPLRTLAAIMVFYGIATVAHGSGFLAVFITGIVISDAPGPYQREIERFHAALASLGETVAFVVLGLAIDLPTLVHTDVWVPGILLGALLAFVVRPFVIGACLLPARLARNEFIFVQLAGLKGAVPILLGTLILAAHPAQASRLFGIVVVIVLFSVVVQGSLVPVAATRLKLEMRTLQPRPWSVGVRLRQESEVVHRLTVATDALADGAPIGRIESLTTQGRVSLVVRDELLVPTNPETVLHAGDTLIVLAENADDLTALREATTRSAD